MKENFGYYLPGHYFTLFDKKYEEVEIEEVEINSHTEEVRYRVYRPCACKTLPSFEIIEDIYRTKEDILSGNFVQKELFTVLNMAEAIGKGCKIDSDNNCFIGWIFKNGHPKLEHFSDVDFCNIGNGWHADTPPIYESESDALAWNDTVIRHEDGSEEVVVGWRKKIQLTPLQQKLIRELKEKFKELERNHIGMVFDYDEDVLFALNTTDVKFEFSTNKVEKHNQYITSHKGFPIIRRFQENGMYINYEQIMNIITDDKD